MESLKVVVFLVVTYSAVARSSYSFQLCPDGQSECPSNSTCCRDPSSGVNYYQCCPLANAVCCNDAGYHCCPGRTTCSSAGTCTSQNGETFPATVGHIAVGVTSKWCPDNKSKKSLCPSTSDTCCLSQDHTWGCCHLPNAVCCSDRIHCCPNGYTCTNDGKGCQKNGSPASTLKASELDTGAGAVVQAVPKRPQMRCPDGGMCSNGNTCCPIEGSKYGCCPVSDGVCCGDGKHCCPFGTTCDLSRGTCDRDKLDASISWLTINIIGNVKCDSCADNHTCCRGGEADSYNCCPLKDGVCCLDHKHCCPRGYLCDMEELVCRKMDSVAKAIEKRPVGNIVCPDQHSVCPSNATCCPGVEAGSYGCCPLVEGKCCKDGKHCCPVGYFCSTKDGTCIKTDIATKVHVLEKQPTSVGDVVCPNGENTCPTDQTCCSTSDREYGCCKYPNAVCCRDRKHCCPFNYYCNDDGTCTDADSVIKAFEKQPASILNVVCPDGQSECPNGNSCCKLRTGQYGCCPLADATCCSDGLHCCPNDYYCNDDGTCTDADSVIKAFEKQPASVLNVVCPGGKSVCPNGNTCCKLLKDRQYGCCPLPNAQCCSDGVHCCPYGYSCDVKVGTCSRGDSVVKMVKKQPASSLVRNVICPDVRDQCPDNNTCCRLTSGKYGCCPLPDATCCSDGVHCCPRDYSCNVASGTCSRADSIMVPVEKEPLSVHSVKCDKKHSCLSGNTCCKTADNKYGCCPEPDAVCCSDKEHCCPDGYRCNTGNNTCTKGDLVVKMLKKQSTSSLVRNVICPDGGSECPNKNTCCKLGSGRYGCCPLVDATCCSDGVHCCPRGDTCDDKKSMCKSGNSLVELLVKEAAKKPSVMSVDHVNNRL